MKEINEKKESFSKQKIHEKPTVKETVNETVEIEPSFYLKEEISDEVKNVMRHIDDILIEVSNK